MTEGQISDTPVCYEVNDGIARITLNRPEVRNALSARLLTALLAALRDAEDAQAVRAIVITGAGSTFCAGADLKEDRDTAKSAPPYAEILSTIMSGPKPVVTVINGPALAGGLGLVAAADIAIAVDSATFAFPEVHIGVTPAIISVPCMAVMARRPLTRYALTAEMFGTAQAEAAGLLTASAPMDLLPGLEQSVLAGLLAAAPSALAATKGLLRDIAAMPVEAGFRHTTLLSASFFDSPEAAEGRLAFREKRRPSWRP